METKGIGLGDFSRFPTNPTDKTEHLVYDDTPAAAIEPLRGMTKGRTAIRGRRQMLKQLNTQDFGHAAVDWQCLDRVRLDDCHILHRTFLQAISQNVKAPA